MAVEEAITLTQDRLAEEGGTMGELLGRFRNRISPILVGDPERARMLEGTGKLPIAMGALPFRLVSAAVPTARRTPERSGERQRHGSAPLPSRHGRIDREAFVREGCHGGL